MCSEGRQLYCKKLQRWSIVILDINIKVSFAILTYPLPPCPPGFFAIGCCSSIRTRQPKSSWLNCFVIGYSNNYKSQSRIRCVKGRVREARSGLGTISLRRY
ncbi:hypothetical protein CHUAL_008065 [Chamberlinius hualienensis]